MKAEEEDTIRKEITKAEWISLTMDMWSSRTMTSFLAITIHFVTDTCELRTRLLDCSSFHDRHTAANIKDRLLSILDKFNLKEKVVAAVSDNGANIKKALHDAEITNIGCYAHTLNLAVNESLAAVYGFDALKKKISSLVTLLHQSNNAKEDFDTCLARLQMEKKILIKDVATRWNSLYLMLERFLDLKDAVVFFQTTDSGRQFSFSQEEWAMAAAVKELLQPAYEATVELSGEHYVSGSKVIPMTKSLLAWYSNKANQLRAIDPLSVQVS